MNMYDFFIEGYNFLRNRKFLPMRIFSPARYIWRNLAGSLLPKVLDKKYHNENISSSSFLRMKNINKRLIVSFTSFPQRINNVWQVVECLSRQTIQPDKIILYLSKEQFANKNDIPNSLLKRTNDKFEIKLVDGDLRSYKKMYYSFQEYPNDLIILVDDDIYYPLNMIEQMLHAFIKNPNSIICRFGYKILYNKDGSLKQYSQWPLIQGATSTNDIFFGTGGGSLYEPAKMYKDTCNRELFTRLCPIADDIWLNAMIRLSKLNIIKLDCGGLLPIQNNNSPVLFKENVINGKNDLQIKDLNNYYSTKLKINVF